MTHILIIEDDHWLADMEASVLTSAGHTVAVAPHALDAMSYIDHAVPDIIITDLLLAGATAFALLHELQSHDDTKHIPIIVCSNLADQVTARQLQAYGVVRVVDKTTMHPSDLVAAVALLQAGDYAHRSH